MNKSIEVNAAQDMANVLNMIGFQNKDFCCEMLNQHRTLQQNFTRLCMEWIKTCADLEEWQYDGRNEASIKACKKIMQDNPDGFSIPLI